jgi:putative transposase
MPVMGAIVELTDREWDLVADLFDPDGRRGAPEVHRRRAMVEAMLWMARTGIQWRYLPERFPPWTAVWSQWRRWRANGVWAAAMGRLARTIRVDRERDPEPSMVIVDAQTAKGGRAGPTFHRAGGRGGRIVGSKRSILVDILGLPFACRVDPARPHDVASARLLLADELPGLPRLRAVVADRAYRGLDRLAARRGLALDIKAPPPGRTGFVPLPAAGQGGARLRPAGTLAAAVALLRADRGVGQGLARGGGHGLPVRAHAGRARLIRGPSGPPAHHVLSARPPTLPGSRIRRLTAGGGIGHVGPPPGPHTTDRFAPTPIPG